MSDSVRRAASLAILAVCLVLVPGFLFLYFGANERPVDAANVFEAFAYPAMIVFPIVGAVITRFRPRNTEGLIFSVAGLAWLLEGTSLEYATYGLITVPGSVPYPEFAAWLSNWLWVLEIAPLTTFALLLFPTGSVPGPRWTVVARLAAAGILAACLGSAFGGSDIEGFDPDVVQNPFSISAISGGLIALTFLGIIAIAISAFASAVSLLLRLKRSEGVERQQLKWFAFAAAIATIAVVTTIVGFNISDEIGEKVSYVLLSLFGLPIAAGVAILRYRLYDIDLIINRTIVYGSLTAILAGVYSASLVLFRFLFESVSGTGSQATTVLTTLVLAALFTPIKNRLQALVDRYVGRAPEPGKDLAKFTEELRLVVRALDPETMLREFASHAMRLTNATGARILVRLAGPEELALSLGTFDASVWTRWPIAARGQDIGWLELASPESSDGTAEPNTPALERAAMIVAEALTLGQRRSEPLAPVQAVSETPA